MPASYVHVGTCSVNIRGQKLCRLDWTELGRAGLRSWERSMAFYWWLPCGAPTAHGAAKPAGRPNCQTGTQGRVRVQVQRLRGQPGMELVPVQTLGEPFQQVT